MRRLRHQRLHWIVVSCKASQCRWGISGSKAHATSSQFSCVGLGCRKRRSFDLIGWPQSPVLSDSIRWPAPQRHTLCPSATSYCQPSKLSAHTGRPHAWLLNLAAASSRFFLCSRCAYFYQPPPLTPNTVCHSIRLAVSLLTLTQFHDRSSTR